jgi:hypothetical protein
LYWLTLRYREQAHSHRGLGSAHGSAKNFRLIEENPPNDVFCALSAAFRLALGAWVYDSSITTTTPEKPS